MDATASIYQRGIEAIRIIASGSHKQEAVDTDFESCLTIETRTLIISQLVLHDDVTTAVVKRKPFNCQTWTGVVSKEIPKMLKPLVNLETLYIYMHCEFDEESIQAHNVEAIRQEVMEDELECWPSKLQDLEFICNVNPMSFVPVGNLTSCTNSSL